MDPHLAAKRCAALVEKILSISECDILCPDEEPDQIVGYIVHRRELGVKVISYVAVKSAFMDAGFCRKMIDHVRDDIVTIATTSERWVKQVSRRYKELNDLKRIGGAAALDALQNMRFQERLSFLLHKLDLVYDPFMDLKYATTTTTREHK